MPIPPLGALALISIAAQLTVNKLTMTPKQRAIKGEEMRRALRHLPPNIVRMIVDALTEGA